MKREDGVTFEIGYISRAHGLAGEVVVRTHDPSSEVLNEVERLHLRLKSGQERVHAIAELAEAPGGDLRVTLKGVQGRDAAQGLVGSTVSVFKAELAPPDEGEVFQGDLVGLEAFTLEGQRLGVIDHVWNTGPVPNLVIRDGEKEWLVPYAHEFVREVDVPGKRVVVVPLELPE